jgi:hypothetical protein
MNKHYATINIYTVIKIVKNVFNINPTGFYAVKNKKPH